MSEFFSILESLERGENPTWKPIFTRDDSRNFQLDINKIKSEDREDPMVEYYCAMSFGINFRKAMKPIYNRPYLPIGHQINATAYCFLSHLENADDVKFLFSGTIRVYDQEELDQHEYTITQIQNKSGNRISIDRDFYVDGDRLLDARLIKKISQFDFIDLDPDTLSMDLERFLDRGRLL